MTRWDEPQARHFDMPRPDGVLTHVGKCRADGSFDFIETPRWRFGETERWVEVDVSMLEGRHDVATSIRTIRRRPATPRELRRGAVRYFVVRDLLEHSYYVMRTPTAGIPNHVSVYGDMDEIMTISGAGAPDAMVDMPAHWTWWNRPERTPLASLELERRTADV